MTFAEACQAAHQASKDSRCTTYVNAILRPSTYADMDAGTEPTIAYYRISDWKDGSTVCAYTEGRWHESY